MYEQQEHAESHEVNEALSSCGSFCNNLYSNIFQLQ